MQGIRVNTPTHILLPMAQHIGAPANPVVSKGDKVSVGTLVAEANGFISSPIYSSVSGTVVKIEDYLLDNGNRVPAILIESDGENRIDAGISPKSVTSLAELQEAARNSGIVGLGGAGFPTAVKLSPKDISKIDTLIVNGAECEPYITSDTRTMIDDCENLKEGIELIMSLLEIKNTLVGVENNKREAIEKLNSVFACSPNINVQSLASRYPQGAEKVLIYNLTGRTVPEGALPSDVGVIVLNVTTV